MPRLLLASLLAAAPMSPDTLKVCDDCEKWNMPHAAFPIAGHTFYVGPAELSVIAIDTGKGIILLDGALPQSAPRVEANLTSLGLRIEDVKLIVNSHAHFNHAGGIAALQRDSGARVVASPAGAKALRQGCPTDDNPQAAPGCAKTGFAPVAAVDELRDGEALRLGDTALTAHFTPAHTPGSTSWTWKSCEGPTCYDVVYADSLTCVSADGFRFTGDATHPDRSATFAHSIRTVAELPCDILLTPHPGFSEVIEHAAARKPGGPNPFVDRNACRSYAADAEKSLQERIAKERGSPSPR